MQPRKPNSMKPKEKKPEIVYRIISSESGQPVGSYSRACCDEYDFGSVSEARNANCHGEFKDKLKYKIARYRVTYELIEEECDPPTEEERAALEAKAAEEKAFNDKYGYLPLEGRLRAMVSEWQEGAIKGLSETRTNESPIS